MSYILTYLNIKIIVTHAHKHTQTHSKWRRRMRFTLCARCILNLKKTKIKKKYYKVIINLSSVSPMEGM